MRARCADLFATHKSQLESFVDMAVHMGTKHNISGVEFAHTKPLYMLALDASKALKYFPDFEQPNTGDGESHTLSTTDHRQTQSSCSDPCYSYSWSCCSCQYSSGDQQCGMSGQCSGSGCRGMCGPSCTQCWYWICDSCCWMGFCESHDDCCSRAGMMSGPCWVRQNRSTFVVSHDLSFNNALGGVCMQSVLSDYMSTLGITCYGGYTCNTHLLVGGGH
jgi:hypothetical protein